MSYNKEMIHLSGEPEIVFNGVRAGKKATWYPAINPYESPRTVSQPRERSDVEEPECDKQLVIFTGFVLLLNLVVQIYWH